MSNQRLSYWSGALLTAVVAFGVAQTARGGADSMPSQQELLQKINVLQSEVEQLKEIARKQQQDAESHDAVKTSSELQRDADQYGQFQLLQSEGFTAGYNDGRFTIQSADKRYVLRPWLQLQFRYESTYRDDKQHGGKDPDTQSGFELRRLKFGFDGNVISPDLTYMFQFAVDRKTGILALEQAYGKYRVPSLPVYVKGGQFKEALDHEQLLASRYLTALDRTFTDDLFFNGEGFVQGLGIGFDNNQSLRAEFDVTDGQRSANTNFQQFPVGASSADYGLNGRAEVKVLGNWKDYDRSSGAYGAKDNYLVFGAGADYTEAGDTHAITHVADVTFGTNGGLGLYAAYSGRAFEHAALASFGTNGGSTAKAVGTNGYDYSLRAQASYAINAHWEPYAQYEYIHLDSSNTPAGARNNFQILRAGVNYYLLKTEARITFDVNYLPQGSPLNDDGIGILGTGAATKTTGWTSGGGNEIIFRAQFQLNL